MKFHRILQDCDLYDGKDKLILTANPRGLTIMLIC